MEKANHVFVKNNDYSIQLFSQYKIPQKDINKLLTDSKQTLTRFGVHGLSIIKEKHGKQS